MRTFHATTEAVLIADEKGNFVTRRVPEIEVELAGIPGDRHYGLLVPADSRQSIYERGTMIANRRQISIISVEECEEIAQGMGIEAIEPEWLGANLLVSGIQGLTLLPVGTRLVFPDGTGLICEGENEPCVLPGKKIAAAISDESLAKKFVPNAKRKRGIVCSIEREGIIRAGDEIRIIRP
ncbi:hypothetical protein FHS18_002755 [Paenibacillus phyllosphaerae]|uniref:MOSC domain-containing protein n=1 Tax=Paenibacillus phyllosphaerae TaxID=274593 RepID=A0A7W5AXQ0_9BACL|nr:MOSC domain-containing protein [Paenibacillus phyllosphaerae]MBB3110688.1 hypothetical protein [Paenibacillus phyllosphaerae]